MMEISQEEQKTYIRELLHRECRRVAQEAIEYLCRDIFNVPTSGYVRTLILDVGLRETYASDEVVVRTLP